LVQSSLSTVTRIRPCIILLGQSIRSLTSIAHISNLTHTISNISLVGPSIRTTAAFNLLRHLIAPILQILSQINSTPTIISSKPLITITLPIFQAPSSSHAIIFARGVNSLTKPSNIMWTNYMAFSIIGTDWHLLTILVTGIPFSSPLYFKSIASAIRLETEI